MTHIKVKPMAIDWNPDLPIFASGSFLRSVSDDFGWLGGFADGERLRCILPYTIVKKAGFKLVRFRVEVIPVGPKLEIGEEKEFLNGVVEYFKSVKAAAIIPPTTNTIFRTWPEGAVAAPYGTFLVNLATTEEKLWTGVHPKHRNKIRSATKSGVQVSAGNQYADRAYELVRETFQRSFMGFMGKDEFQRMMHGLGEHVMVLVAEHNGTLQGCAVIPYSNHCAHYVYGGTAAEPVTGAMNLLQWEAMRRFREMGVRQYDFVGVRINPEKGSKAEGLSNFKERFGGRLVQGYMWKYRLGFLGTAAYSMAIKWLRGGDIVDQEHHKLGSAQPLSMTQGAGGD